MKRVLIVLQIALGNGYISFDGLKASIESKVKIQDTIIFT